MPDKPLSFSATCALLILMAEDREVSNPELKEKYGVTVTGKERTALNDGGFVTSRRTGRSFSHVLTDKGWHHASELVRDGISAPGTGFAAAAVKALVGNLQRHIDRSETSLAEIFGRVEGPVSGVHESSMPETTEETTAEPIAQQSIAPPPIERVPASEDVETLIRKAYAQLADRPNAWVSLTRLRPLLGDAPRNVVDAALRHMIGLPDVRLVPESNQKMLTDEDRGAAVVIGDQAKHLILIGA
ncbi:hypothetical protein SAMN05421833_109249 [Microbispora rosea]|uniref:Uncharacterized protein n=1 Tax=Microbispora rosea TaxID=58117 RepID=A0A1N7BAU7_9ACTN|nr:hypothetical protein [Microbispora rosea]GIH52931.1 hypothetical protein Mro03_81100 [Microbispora rosea subsp. rosea]SIR48457.1 hypothetical protein SAMN05421833_109249 [Microbispora rosea]